MGSKIPIDLIYSRLLTDLLLVGLSYYRASHYCPVAVALLLGVVTDVFDGIVARQLYSTVDQVFWLVVVLQNWRT